MRTLSASLTAAQVAPRKPLYKVALTLGANSYTYEQDRILPDSSHIEEPYSSSALIILNNADNSLVSRNFKGYQGVISYGFTGTSGDEYSACAPMDVMDHQSISAAGQNAGILNVLLVLAGKFNKMAEEHASALYEHAATSTSTVKTLFSAVAGVTLAPFTHLTAYTVTYDSEDSLIDTYQPKDAFRVQKNATRLETLKELIGWTKCVMRIGADGAIHVFVPTVS